jgi:uncharacterized membrane protein YqaE (UPF0057 family)
MKPAAMPFVWLCMSVLVVIAAVLLPPLGVFLVAGMGRDFWIAMGLTFLFYLPGMAFALFIVLGGSTARLAESVVRLWESARA